MVVDHVLERDSAGAFCRAFVQGKRRAGATTEEIAAALRVLIKELMEELSSLDGEAAEAQSK